MREKSVVTQDEISLSEALDFLPESIEDLSKEEIKMIMAQSLILINEARNEFLGLLEIEYGREIEYDTLLHLNRKDKFTEVILFDYSTMLFDRAIEKIELNNKLK